MQREIDQYAIAMRAKLGVPCMVLLGIGKDSEHAIEMSVACQAELRERVPTLLPHVMRKLMLQIQGGGGLGQPSDSKDPDSCEVHVVKDADIAPLENFCLYAYVGNDDSKEPLSLLGGEFADEDGKNITVELPVLGITEEIATENMKRAHRETCKHEYLVRLKIDSIVRKVT